MNKLLVLIAIGLVGAGATYAVSIVNPNLLSDGTALLSSLVMRAQGLVTWGQGNLSALFAGASAIVMPAYLIFNKLYTRAKDANAQKAKDQITIAQNKLLAESQARVDAESKNIDLQSQVDTLTKAQTSVADLTATVKRVESDKAKLQSDLTAAQRLNNLVMHPTEEELVRKLQKEGYTIVKTVK